MTQEQIEFYSSLENDGKFDAWQMRAIRHAFLDGLTTDQVALCADPKFDYMQMDEICTGLEQGLSMDQVRMYADPELTWYQMDNSRCGLENNSTMATSRVKDLKRIYGSNFNVTECADTQAYSQSLKFSRIVQNTCNEQNISLEQLSKKSGIKLKKLRRDLRGYSKLNLKHIILICNALNLDLTLMLTPGK
jgi:hypothetical protein